jgi:hypothetical protein
MASATAHRGGAEYAEKASGQKQKNLRALRVSAVRFWFCSCLCVSVAAKAQETVGAGSPAVNAPGGIAAAAEMPKHPIELSGYAILNGAWTQSDPNLFSVGRNDGFALGDARVELTGRPADSLWLYLSIDGATPIVGSDPTQGQRTVSLKDAYGVWSPGGHVRVQAGQFKAPQDVEELLEETELKFVSRSIVSHRSHRALRVRRGRARARPADRDRRRDRPGADGIRRRDRAGGGHQRQRLESVPE